VDVDYDYYQRIKTEGQTTLIDFITPV